MRKNHTQRLVFLLVFVLPFFAPISDVLAVASESTNYKIDGGQVAPISGDGESGSFSIETGGNPISGESSSTNFQVQQGAPLDPAAPVLAPVLAPVGSIGGFPTPIALNIEVRNISPTIVEIVFETNTSAAKARIDYGTLGNYNLQVGETESRQYHRFILYDLSPGTRYNYRIHLEITSNRTNDMGPFFFTTLPAITAIPNVSQFRAEPGETVITLNWQNPIFDKYLRTIIVKDTVSYPRNASDGEVIFSGTGTFYRDTDVTLDTLYFYTAFVESADGRFSSGVIQSAQLGVPPPEEEIPEEGEIIPTEPPVLPPGVTPTPETGIREKLVNIFTLLKQRVTEGYYRLVEVFSNLSREAREQVNRIKQGLIDQYGRLQREPFEALTEEERKQIEEIVGRELPTTFTKDVIDTITPVNLLGGEDIDWRVFADSDVLLTIPNSVFLKDVALITVSISRQAYILVYNDETDSFEAIITAPKTKGKYEVVVQIIYTDNTFEEVNRTLLVDPYGAVYTREFGQWSWTRPWNILFIERVPVEGAEVTLHTLSRTNELVLWPAHLYNQYNPIITDEDGSFAFVVSSGTYRITVEADGFRAFQGDLFEVEEQVVNIDVELKKELTTIEVIMLILGIIVLGVLGIIIKNRETHAKS